MIKAIHNNVVLEKKEPKQSSGIYMVSSGSSCYVVINTGNEVSTVKAGDTVVIKELSLLKEHHYNNTKYFITNIDNIIAIVED